MHEHFARSLSAHYVVVTQGAREFYRFSNGMSQNKLAEAVAEETPFDTSTLSRYMSGERLPTVKTLRTICAVLELSDDEENLLRAAVVRDIGDEAGFDLDITSDKRVVDLLLRDVARLRAAMDEEDVERALEFLRDLQESQQDFSAGESPPPPLMRVITMVEAERRALMKRFSLQAPLPRGTDEVPNLADAYMVEDLLNTLDLPDEIKRLGRRSLVDGESAEEIAASEDLSLATVYSVIEGIKKRLLQQLAEADSDDSV